jgi:hypothetical protein
MEPALRALLWISLGGWIGALALFAFGVAPLAFTILPSAELAGKLVGPLLTGLNLYGMAAGVGLAVGAAATRRGPVLIGLPLFLALVCAVSEFWVTAGIGEVRLLAFGPDSSAESAARFALLHQSSRALYGVVTLGAVVCALLHAREDARGAEVGGRGKSGRD